MFLHVCIQYAYFFSNQLVHCNFIISNLNSCLNLWKNTTEYCRFSTHLNIKEHSNYRTILEPISLTFFFLICVSLCWKQIVCYKCIKYRLHLISLLLLCWFHSPDILWSTTKAIKRYENRMPLFVKSSQRWKKIHN